MKKLLLSIFATFSFIILIAQKENLLLNLAPGKVYFHNLQSSTKVTQEINGQKLDITISILGLTEYNVRARKDSIYSIEVKYKKLGMKMTLPTGEMTFGSDNKDDKTPMSSIINSLVDKPFFVTLTKHGKILEVKNLDQIFENIFDNFSQLSPEQKKQMQSQLMQSYGEKAFKGSFELVTSIYPTYPIGKGDTWTSTVSLQTNMSGVLSTKYSLKEISQKTLLIHGDGDFDTPNNDNFTELNGMPTKYSLKGQATSELTIDKQSGWILDARIIQRMTGFAEIKDNPTIPGGMKIPMYFETNIVYTAN